jgi:Tfp pilus assembly protein PilF
MTKQNNRASKSSTPSPESNQYTYIRWIALVIAILYFLPALGVVSRTSFWAFSVNTYLPTGITIAHLILVALMYLLLFRSDLLGFTRAISRQFYYILFACALVLIAIFLREKVPFYGDGYFFQKDIITNLPIKYAEVLTMLIYRAVYIALPQSARTGAAAYQIVNTICVVPTIITMLYFTRRVAREYLPFILFTFLGFGANVLCFGHVENYTLVYLTMLLYLYAITRQHVNIAILAFLLGLSICLHLLALCLVPSFFFALWRIRNKKLNRYLLPITLGTFMLPFAITALFSFVAGMTPGRAYAEVVASITTLSTHTGQRYFESIFHVHHWIDVINLLFFGLPTFPIIAVLIFTGRRKESIWKNQDVQLILALAIPFMAFIIFFNTPLGLPRDWDLGVTALIWRIAAVIYLARYIAPKVRIKPGFLTAIGLLSFVLTLPWFILQHLPQYGVKRFNDILNARIELAGTAYGYEILGRYYHDIKDYPNSAENYEKAAQYDPQNWRRYYSVAMEYLNLNDSKPALMNLRKAYEINPQESMILNELGMMYHETGQNDSALVMFQRMYQQDTANIKNRHNMGVAYFWAGQYDRAYEVFTGILKMHPNQYNALLGLIDVSLAEENLVEAKRLIDVLESRYGTTRTVQHYRKLLQQHKNK